MTLPVDDRRGGGNGVLERFLADIVVDDYADTRSEAGDNAAGDNAVGDHAAGDTEPGSRRSDRSTVVVAVLVAAVIGVVIAGALVNTRLSSAERQQTRSALVDRITAVTQTVAERQVLVDERAARVQAQQDALLAASQDGPATADAITRLSQLAAATEMAGPGITVTLDDAPNAEEGSLNRVLDRDLQDIVNQLWRAGATGVAINEQRLTATSAIRAAGEAILVNYQPISRPYRVVAVGAVDEAQERSGLQALLAQLTDDYGLVTDARGGDVALPAGEVRAPRFASTTTTAEPDSTATIEPGGTP